MLRDERQGLHLRVRRQADMRRRVAFSGACGVGHQVEILDAFDDLENSGGNSLTADTERLSLEQSLERPHFLLSTIGGNCAANSAGQLNGQ